MRSSRLTQTFVTVLRDTRLKGTSITSSVSINKQPRTRGFASSRVEEEQGSSLNPNNSNNNSSTSTSSVAKAWIASIVGARKGKEQKKEETKKDKIVIKRSTSNISSSSSSSPSVPSRPGVYRRRLADMSWTKEPMDDKLVWVDCEMTGLDYNNEMIMEIGVIITDKDLREIARKPSLIIQVPEDKLNGMVAWCVKHHGESGLTEACRQSQLTSEQADDELYEFVKKYAKEKECPMAGNSIYMDRIFIAKQFPKFHSHFHYRNVDVSTIKEMVRRWFPKEYGQAPKKKFAHRVLDDITDSISELEYYRTAVFKQTTDSEQEQSNGQKKAKINSQK